jgi:5-deoxy-glucuronate isomerase
MTADLVTRAGLHRPAGLHLPAGAAAGDGFDLVVTPESADWGYSSLRILTLAPDGSRTIDTADDEVLVVPLAGGAVVSVDDQEHRLAGRRNVFAGATDFLYLPIGVRATITAPTGGRFALCGARTPIELPVRYRAAADVAVEVRGAGPASRLVRNFATADAFEAGALIACEVITPGGNWSSYPAHKHDEKTATESELEEIYYFEIAAGPDGEPGLGYHRTSSSPGHPVEVLAEVRDRDVALVPFGWHGPTVAAPGHDMYYLNVMAGPDVHRAWKISDHPDQAWVRGTWSSQTPDPRVTDGRFGR